MNRIKCVRVMMSPLEEEVLRALAEFQAVKVPEFVRGLVHTEAARHGLWPPALRGAVEGQGVGDDGKHVDC